MPEMLRSAVRRPSLHDDKWSPAMHIFDAITLRRSVREYATQPIADDILQRLCEAMRIAPSP